MDGDEQLPHDRVHGHGHGGPNPRPDRVRTGLVGGPRGGLLPDVHGRLPGEGDDGVAPTTGLSKRSGGRTPPPAIRVPAGLVVLVGPPTSGKTSFVRALIARRQIDAEAVVSTDEIRAEFFGTSPAEAESGAADALIFEERDRRIAVRLAAGHSAVAESTNVTPQARARLIAIAGLFDASVTMLRFDPDVIDLLQQHTERGRTDLTAADIRAYAAVMTREAGADQLRSEGATAVHDVPGRREAITPSEAAARFSFA